MIVVKYLLGSNVCMYTFEHYKIKNIYKFLEITNENIQVPYEIYGKRSGNEYPYYPEGSVILF